jgi:NhaP-type Na+/H+ and K+/H+ antiporter
MDDAEAQNLDQYVATTSFIMRLFIFILLGSQVNFALINQYLLGGVLVVAVFMLVARPATVFLCALPDRRARWSLNEMLFMCWTRETGAIPAALAGLLLGMKAPGAHLIASVTFIAILMTILIQAPPRDGWEVSWRFWMRANSLDLVGSFQLAPERIRAFIDGRCSKECQAVLASLDATGHYACKNSTNRRAKRLDNAKIV